jgi:hypothetical protein
MLRTEFSEYLKPKDCVHKKKGANKISASSVHGINLILCEQEQRRVRRPPLLVLSTSSPSTDGLCAKCSGTEDISVQIGSTGPPDLPGFEFPVCPSVPDPNLHSVIKKLDLEILMVNITAG